MFRDSIYEKRIHYLIGTKFTDHISATFQFLYFWKKSSCTFSGYKRKTKSLITNGFDICGMRRHPEHWKHLKTQDSHWLSLGFERKISGCWTHSAFKWHRNEPVLSYSILSWDSLLFSCYQFCPLWLNANLFLQAKVDYGLLSRVTPTRKDKWQNSHSQSFLELLWLSQCGMVLNVASQFINHSCSHVTFPSSVLQLFPLASLSVQPKTD